MGRFILMPGLVALLAMAVAGAAWAQPGTSTVHRAVFELTTDNADAWGGLLNNLENLQAHYGPEHTELEVVAHGSGIGFVLKSHTANAARMAALAGHGVTFAACNNTMRRKQMTKDMLLPFVIVVPAGIAEVLEKQEAGWSYIKAGV